MNEPTTVYWFSGTGNSLAVARRIAEATEGAVLVPVARAVQTSVRPRGVVGVVCPVYFEGLPLVVRDFLGRLDAREVSYAFLVLTAGAYAGWAVPQARRLFRRAGRRLDAAFVVVMPDNYIAEMDLPSPATQTRRLGRARRRVDRIAGDVANRTRRWGVGAAAPLGALAYAVMGRRFARTCARRDERFVVTDSCTGCRICVRVCPVGNIDLVGGRPAWLHRCQQCYACIHACPETAIQIRRRPTAHRRRYRHPEVSLADLARQRDG